MALRKRCPRSVQILVDGANRGLVLENDQDFDPFAAAFTRDLALQTGRELACLGDRDRAAEECGGQEIRDTPDQRGLRARLDEGVVSEASALRVSQSLGGAPSGTPVSVRIPLAFAPS